MGERVSKANKMNKKELVLILSTMRSGSTLLKALLGVAPDVSHLPEIDFQQKRNLYSLSKRPIVVFKKPAWFHETWSYPRLPRQPVKKIILIRNPVDTVVSLKKMLFGKRLYYLATPLNSLLLRYWYNVTRNLLQRDDLSKNAMYVCYDELVKSPKKVTKEIFQFLGSKQKKGIHKYERNEAKWNRGSDDWGEKINSLVVREPSKKQDSKLIKQSKYFMDKLKEQDSRNILHHWPSFYKYYHN